MALFHCTTYLEANSMTLLHYYLPPTVIRCLWSTYSTLKLHWHVKLTSICLTGSKLICHTRSMWSLSWGFIEEVTVSNKNIMFWTTVLKTCHCWPLFDSTTSTNWAFKSEPALEPEVHTLLGAAPISSPLPPTPRQTTSFNDYSIEAGILPTHSHPLPPSLDSGACCCRQCM